MDMEMYSKYVLTILENGSLTKAAAVLGISQPALSSGLKALERKLGYVIFDRKCSPVIPTRAGRAYISYLKKQAVLQKELKQKIDDINNDENREVVVCAPATYIESILLPFLDAKHKEIEHINVRIKAATLSEAMEKAKANEIDCFISTSDEITNDYKQKLIDVERIYLCIPKDYEINKQLKDYVTNIGSSSKCFDYTILKEYDFVFLEENQPLQKMMDVFFKENSLSPRRKLEVDQVTTALNFTIKGYGMCFASENVLKTCKEKEKLCIYSLPEYVPKRNIYISCYKESYVSQSCDKLVSLLVKYQTEREEK